MSLHLMAKALIRIEKKADEILKLLLATQQQPGSVVPMAQPLNVPNQGACPLCQKPIRYQNLVDPQTGQYIPIRVCECEPVVVQLTNQGA